MGVRHKSLALEGVQFHPESILTPDGPKLLAAFLASRRLGMKSLFGMALLTGPTALGANAGAAEAGFYAGADIAVVEPSVGASDGIIVMIPGPFPFPYWHIAGVDPRRRFRDQLEHDARLSDQPPSCR